MNTESNYWQALQSRRMTRRRLLRGAAITGTALAVAAAVGCGGEEEAGPAPAAQTGTPAAAQGTGTPAASEAPKLAELLRLQWGFFPREFDAHTALGPEIWHVIGSRPIRRHAKTGELIGELFVSWELADPQGLELVLKLRPNVYTHDKPPANGRIFTAEDAAYNLVRITGALDPANRAKYQRASTLHGLERAEAVDDTTVRVVMSQPNSAFFAGLAEFRNMFMPKDVVEELGFDNPSALAGTGAFMVREFEDERSARFVRHPKFFEQGQPHFERLEYLASTDRATVISAFLSKQIALVGVLPPEKDALTSGRPDARLRQHPGLNWWHLRFNINRQPWSDPRVRRAFALIIDREALAKARWGDFQWALTGPVVPAFPEAFTREELLKYPGYDSSRKQEDIARAREILSEAGLTEFSIEILPGSPLPTNEFFENAIRCKDQIERALDNVTVTVTPPVDTSAFAVRQSSNNFDLISYTITTLPDPVLELVSQYHSTGSRNYGKFVDPEADALIDKAFITLDNTQRTQIIREFQDKFLSEWLPVIQFYVNPDVTLVDGRYRLENEEEQIGSWNPGGIGYGGQSLRFWYEV